MKTPVEIPAELENVLTVALYVTYNAGNAGVGWPSDHDRKVRIPWLMLVNALSVFPDVCAGEPRLSGLPDGIVPDSARVVIEPRAGKSHNYAQCAPYIGTYASFVK